MIHYKNSGRVNNKVNKNTGFFSVYSGSKIVKTNVENMPLRIAMKKKVPCLGLRNSSCVCGIRKWVI
jgi:hypothetical protein